MDRDDILNLFVVTNLPPTEGSDTRGNPIRLMTISHFESPAPALNAPEADLR